MEIYPYKKSEGYGNILKSGNIPVGKERRVRQDFEKWKYTRTKR